MKQTFILSALAASLVLAGCGGDSIETIQATTTKETPSSRVVFDPGAGELNIPNDILMLPGDDGFFDYTLNIPVAQPEDFSDPQTALNALDGWSTTAPFVVNVETPPGVSLDANSLAAGVRLFEATLGLNPNDPECLALGTPSVGCKLGDELVFGEDFIAQLADQDTIQIVPLKPLRAAQGHMLVLTTELKDSSGKSVKGSTSWESLSLDISTQPLATTSQLGLQGIIDSFVKVLEPTGLAREELIYVSAFNTVSVVETYAAIKQLTISEFAQRLAAGDPTAAQALPTLTVSDAAVDNSMELLGLVSIDVVNGAVAQGISGLPASAEPLIPVIAATDFSALTTCDGLLATANGQLADNWGAVNDFAVGVAAGILPQVAPFCAANLYQGEVNLPYFSAVPTADNPLAPMNSFWRAACDSGIVLAAASAEVLASTTPGQNAESCNAIGLADLRLGENTLDRDRMVTRYNPIPQVRSVESINAWVTVPNVAVANALGVSLERPQNGWPVVVMSHGITANKESMLAASGALSLAGFATVVIDQPLHGERGFDLDGDGVDELNASTVSATHYMNLSALVTTRDNVRQSVIDHLHLRLATNAIVDETNAGELLIDGSKASLYGVSLGAITMNMVGAIANLPMEEPLAALASLYQVQAVALESPGAGIANFLFDSAAFGPLIKGSLMAQAVPEFQAFLVSQFGDTDVSEAQLSQAAVTFLENAPAESAAAINATFEEFIFAATTVTDAADPVNFASLNQQVSTTLQQTVVGDGGAENLPDQVIPVTTAKPLSGQIPLAIQMGLPQIVSTVTGEQPTDGYVLFNAGAHASSLDPSSNAAVTREMQQQIATFLATGGRTINIADSSLIAN